MLKACTGRMWSSAMFVSVIGVLGFWRFHTSRLALIKCMTCIQESAPRYVKMGCVFCMPMRFSALLTAL